MVHSVSQSKRITTIQLNQTSVPALLFTPILIEYVPPFISVLCQDSPLTRLSGH
jgi:hypothetical protein